MVANEVSNAYDQAPVVVVSAPQEVLPQGLVPSGPLPDVYSMDSNSASTMAQLNDDLNTLLTQTDSFPLENVNDIDGKDAVTHPLLENSLYHQIDETSKNSHLNINSETYQIANIDMIHSGLHTPLLVSDVDATREMQIQESSYMQQCELDGVNKLGTGISESVESLEAMSTSDSSSHHSCPYYTAEYTDSVSSTDSKKFLIPLNSNEESRNENSQPLEFEVLLENVSVPGTDFKIDILDGGDCSTNKLYSHVSVDTSEYNLLSDDGPVEEFRSRTNTMLGLLGQSPVDVGSTVHLACQKALMYLKDETVGSSFLLPGSCRDLSNAHKDFSHFNKDCEDNSIIRSNKHTKNLIAISICITLCTTAFGSVRNLQSSINKEGGVGMTSLAICFASFVIGSIFSPFLVQNFQPRKCLIISLFPQLLWIACNMYPAMWLMLPASVLMGAATATTWNALSTYVTFLAKGYSEKHKEAFEHTLSRYFGIFGLSYQTHIIVGNLIASLVLMFANQPGVAPIVALNATSNTSTSTMTYGLNAPMLNTLNNTLDVNASSLDAINKSSHYHLCGATYCHHFVIEDEGMHVTNATKYLLFGIYLGCIVISIAIACLMLEPLNQRLFSAKLASCAMVGEHLMSLGKFFAAKKVLLLVPLLFYSNMQNGFLTAEVTTAFISCPLGIYMVGFTMMCFGVCSCISSFLSGWLNKFLGRITLICAVPLRFECKM